MQALSSTLAGNEIHPVNFVFQSSSIWIGWVSADEPGEAVVTNDGKILWGLSQRDLVKRCADVYGAVAIESATMFDMNKVLDGLCSRKAASDEVINCWNMLKDVSLALGAPRAVYRFDGVAEDRAYMAFFSATSGGELLGFAGGQVADRDFEVAKEVISNGVLMLLDATVQVRSQGRR